MAKQVTFIHSADLHLGAPFRGLRALSPTWANRLLTASVESYDRVIEAAIKHKVDFVIIAGDIFDSARASYADHVHFFQGLKKLDEAGIAAYLCAGNHDPYTSWQQDYFAFPENTKLFPADKPGFFTFEKDGETVAILGGRSFYNQAWRKDKSIAEGITGKEAREAAGKDAPFTIGVIHTGLIYDPLKAPTEIEELSRAGIDYWALGHIHKRHRIPEKNPKIVFPGCVQGRDINETGKRGVYKTTLTEGKHTQLEFIPTASVVWQRMEINVEECKTLAEISEQIIREVFIENSKAHCEEMCVRITLVGKTPLHTTLEKPGVIGDLRRVFNEAYSVFFCDSMISKTVLPIDKKMLAKEKLFPAALLQASSQVKKEKEESLLYLQNEFLKKNIVMPPECEKLIPQLIEEAENLALDMLGKRDAS